MIVLNIRSILMLSRDPIPESGHERLWQNAMREKDIYTISVYSF